MLKAKRAEAPPWLFIYPQRRWNRPPKSLSTELKGKKNNMAINNTPKSILVIDDEENMCHMLATVLTKAGYTVDTATNGREGIDKLDQHNFEFVLCDIKMPRMGGMDFLKAAGERLKGITVIMMSAYGSIDSAVEAMKLGAYDYISKPFKPDEVLLTLKKADERESLQRENRQLKEKLSQIEGEFRFGKMIAKSSAMKPIFHLAKRAAQYDTTVLILGESGTGKELIARGIHFEGKRARKTFVPVNCGGIPETLLESELFGYKKGAFTGADKDKKGLFQEAEGGTIFLDEIGELPMSLQVKLLRVLQESEVRPVGGAKADRVDVRVIAATAKDLAAEVENNNFREDLFYRLNVLSIELPPLCDRTEDVHMLCDHFLGRFNNRLNKAIESIAPAAMSILLSHDWPGNVRELENMIERAVVLADGPVLIPEYFPATLLKKKDVNACEDDFEGFSLKTAQKKLEEKMIVRALQETGGNRTHAARLLEISHPSLLNKIKRYEIPL